jgi:hypothetical protein
VDLTVDRPGRVLRPRGQRYGVALPSAAIAADRSCGGAFPGHQRRQLLGG